MENSDMGSPRNLAINKELMSKEKFGSGSPKSDLNMSASGRPNEQKQLYFEDNKRFKPNKNSHSENDSDNKPDKRKRHPDIHCHMTQPKVEIMNMLNDIKTIVRNAQNAYNNASAENENVVQAKTNFTNSIVELVNVKNNEDKIREAAEKLFDRYISCDEKGFVAAAYRFIVAVQAYIMGTKDKLFGSEEQKAQRWQECVAERCAEVIANKAQKIAAAL